jgi:hypothetical protein
MVRCLKITVPAKSIAEKNNSKCSRSTGKLININLLMPIKIKKHTNLVDQVKN